MVLFAHYSKSITVTCKKPLVSDPLGTIWQARSSGYEIATGWEDAEGKSRIANPIGYAGAANLWQQVSLWEFCSIRG